MRNRNAYLNNSDYLDKKHGLLESFPNGPFFAKITVLLVVFVAFA